MSGSPFSRPAPAIDAGFLNDRHVPLRKYAQYYVSLRDGSDAYLRSHLSFVQRLEEFVGREVLLDDLSEDLANAFLESIQETNSPSTRSWKRKAFLRLWKHAASNRGLAHPPPHPDRDRVRVVKRRGVPPRAWSVEQVQQMLGAVDDMAGHYGWQRDGNLIVRRLYWRSYIMAAWSLGWRRCDLLMLQYESIPPDGKVVISQHKTGKVLYACLNPQALDAVREFWTIGTVDRETLQPVTPDRREVWPPLGNRSTWGKISGAVLRRAGLTGGMRRIRASAGTNVELINPGKGHHFLGNTQEVFFKHYFDRTLAADLPQPVDLESDEWEYLQAPK